MNHASVKSAFIKSKNKNLFYKYSRPHNRLKIRKDILDMINTDNSVLNYPVDKAHGFLNMFKSVFTLDDGSLPTISINKSVSSLSNIYFSSQKVCAKLSKLKVLFSSTPDEIPGFFFEI